MLSPDSLIDPVLFFPTEVSTKIFRYLSACDMLQASLVSTEWYDFIAETPACMRKLKIKIVCTLEKDLSEEIIHLLAKSTRKYENFDLSGYFAFFEDSAHNIFAAPGRKWKRVRVSNISFTTTTQAMDFFESIEPTVEELRMSSVYISEIYHEGYNRNLMFPKLKKLYVKHIQTVLYHECFQNLKNLEYLSIWSSDQTVASLDSLIHLLKTNSKLKRLEISGSVFNQIMYHDIIDELTFKLEILTIDHVYRVTPYHEVIQANFTKFLCRQRSLLKLSLRDWMGMETMKTIMRMEKLKELNLRGIGNSLGDNWENVILTRSLSIKVVHFYEATDSTMLKTLISALPNITCFIINEMHSEVFQHLAETAKKIRILSVGSLIVDEISGPNVFASLKRLIVFRYTKELYDYIDNNPTEKRSQFEKLLVQIF